MDRLVGKNELAKIGAFVASLRESKGFTQADFARQLGTSQSAVARMEKGQQNFSTELLAKISKVLGQSVIRLADRSINFRIRGGKSLSGTVTINTSKNSAVALLCASLLNQQKTELQGVPKVEDVFSIIRVTESLGVQVRWTGENTVQITPPKKFDWENIDKQSAAKTRSSLLLLGALSSRLGNFTLPYAGGCKLGERTVRPHLFALERLGINVLTKDDYYQVKVAKRQPAEIVLYESGDTVTENALMAASVIPGKTVIKYASANYMVQELCNFLQLFGVQIEGVGTTTLTVQGKLQPSRAITYHIGEDPTEAMLFLAIAAVTGSSLKIQRCPIDFLELELLKLEKMGFRYKILKRYKSYNDLTALVDIQTYPSKLVALEEKIYSRPYPGLNIDNLPFFVAVATQAKGTTLIHDWVYEDRAVYYLELNKLGAKIRLADQHRVFIEGPAQLQAAEVICPPALRPAAILLIGMLAANGTSVLRNVYSINRGYEDLCRRLQNIGAEIELISEL